VLSWHEAAKTINADGMIDGGPFAIVDKRDPGAPLAFIDHAKRSPFVLVEVPPKTARSKPKIRRVEVPVVILAEDGTWHRPLTPLELARLQDLPATVDGAPLQLHGENVGEWAERIGQAVPVGTARAIGDQMLLTLLSSDVGAGLAPSGGPVWVAPGFEAVGVSP
jgi:site-specific DNA-cytosine methylase